MATSKDPMDILPVEVGEKVLSYLDPEQLALCSIVSRKWRILSSSNTLWKKFTPEKETLVLDSSEWDDANQATVARSGQKASKYGLRRTPHAAHQTEGSWWSYYKRGYARRARTLKKWRQGDYRAVEVNPSSDYATVGNGAILVELRGSTMRMYDTNWCQEVAQPVQEVEVWPERLPPGPEDGKEDCRLASSTEEFVAVIGADKYLMLYSYRPERGLEPEDCLYLDYRTEGFLEDVRPMSLEVDGPPRKRFRLVHWGSVSCCRDGLLLLGHADYEAYVWSRKERRCLCALAQWPTGYVSITSDGRSVFVGCDDGIYVYWVSGKARAKLDYGFRCCGSDLRVSFNAEALMCWEGESFWHCAWDAELRRLGAPFRRGGGALLHPSLAAVAHLAEDACGWFIVLTDLRTRQLLWRSPPSQPLPLPPVSFSHNFLTLEDRLLAYFFRREDGFSWILLDLETGRLLANNQVPPRDSPRDRFLICSHKIIVTDSGRCLLFN
ncbi:hypothetical protein AAG570_004439 [Ranatra chinensis]|uniref:F-box domain-containing protein n=1 Tax=Ranatra chinensis TaxID=642074 RepID=A0ABD0Y0X9_9HEMI